MEASGYPWNTQTDEHRGIHDHLMADPGQPNQQRDRVHQNGQEDRWLPPKIPFSQHAAMIQQQFSPFEPQSLDTGPLDTGFMSPYYFGPVTQPPSLSYYEPYPGTGSTDDPLGPRSQRYFDPRRGFNLSSPLPELSETQNHEEPFDYQECIIRMLAKSHHCTYCNRAFRTKRELK